MNKNAIKKVAIAARNRLIATVSDRAGMLGITKEKISQPASKGHGFEIYKTAAGTENTLNLTQIEQRRKLVDQIEARGFDVVMEEVAYTWFNRICAIRFMEVNDYLPTRVRVLSSLKEGKNEPDLLTKAPDVDLDFTEAEREWILTAKEQNRPNELFSMLFIKQCNKLSRILPELFEATEDYTEMLLSLSYTNKDDVVRLLVDGIDEADFNVTTKDESGNPIGQVEIIGWLYQYYNTELKDDTFAKLKKNIKISKERIPAATQLFTPHWIVRYMVENSVGRIWIEHLRAIDPDTDEKAAAERFGWKYYLPEAEQEPEVNSRLAEIRKSYSDLKPTDILCIDPCMGSGHIIVAQFDVLMDIYTSVGYGEREAAFEIIEHNLHGLDIDKRAYQLAYFAVMMKGRQYNRRFFRGKNQDDVSPKPKVYAFVESNKIERGQLKYFGAGMNEIEKINALNQMSELLDTFKDAREYGSILNVDNYEWALLRKFATGLDDLGQMHIDSTGLDQVQETMEKIINLGEVMAKKYDAVVTNPPYMGSSSMSPRLQSYINTSYPDVKTDLFAVFIQKCEALTKPNRHYAMITMHGWMFLGSFKKLRSSILNRDIINLIHLGSRAFEEISGEVVQTVAFVIRKSHTRGNKGKYYRLTNIDTFSDKEAAFLRRENEFLSAQDDYTRISDSPIAYWVSDAVFDMFEKNHPVSKYGLPLQGSITGDNDRFLKLWFEVDYTNIEYNARSEEDTYIKKWYPHNKGGAYRRWYGNYDYVINWKDAGFEIKHFVDSKGKLRSRPQNIQHFFKKGISWSDLTMGKFGARFVESGFTFNVSGPTFVPFNEKDIPFVLGYFNSPVFQSLLDISCQGLHYHNGIIAGLPICRKITDIERKVWKVVELSKEDWNENETSWDYKKCPMVCDTTEVEEAFEHWKLLSNKRSKELKQIEESINAIIIKACSLENEISPRINEEDVALKRVEARNAVQTLISYAVGCMFGRYSLDVEGLAYAGGEWDVSKYNTFLPDKDNIIPITDEEYFEDDIVGLFCGWLKQVYGADTLEENLDFIARALGNKGDTPREVIRNYFLNGFFKDHCNTYSVTGSGKRPIYWLFDSGKQNGFKALIYLHRYNQDTVGRVRTDYLHKTQKAIEQAMAGAQYTLENSRSGTEKSKATRRISRYTKQLAEIQLYDQAIAHIANKRIVLDLDDGVKANYAKFQGVEVAREGMKTVKVDLLARI